MSNPGPKVARILTAAGIEQAGQAPFTTAEHEIGYGWARHQGRLPPGAMRAAAGLIAERVRKREEDVPVPEGM